MLGRFEIIPVAEASITTLMKSIDKVIINPIIFFLFALAMVYFIYGLAKYLLSPDNEEVRKTSKDQMIWGVVGLFVMVAVFGIMQIITTTLGVTNVKIQSNGDYQVNNVSTDGKGNVTVGGINQDMTGGSQGKTENQYVLDNNKPLSVKIVDNSQSVDLTAPNPGDTTPVVDYTKSPFDYDYTSSSLCWREALYKTDTVEYNALNAARTQARADFLSNLGITDNKLYPSYPMENEVQTLYDKTNKTYYAWFGVVAPLNNGTMKDCKMLPKIQDESDKTSSLSTKYSSNQFYNVTIGSGYGKTMALARGIALRNALIEMATLQGLNDITKVKYTNIPDEKYFGPDENGDYDYFLAIMSPK